jgi:hypothetical protein
MDATTGQILFCQPGDRPSIKVITDGSAEKTRVWSPAFRDLKFVIDADLLHAGVPCSRVSRHW